MARKKITEEGQPCRRCETPVIKRVQSPKARKGRKFYFAYYFYCPKCKAVFLIDEAKRLFEPQNNPNESAGDSIGGH